MNITDLIVDEDECKCEEMEQGQPCVHCIETKYE
jgi:hypothetical protein